MRIGVDARFLGATSYGLAQYSENLLQALSRADAENEYTVFVNVRLNRKLKLGRNFRVMPVAGHPRTTVGLMRFSRLLRRQNIDLLHVHFPMTPIGFDKPVLVTVHDVVPFRHSDTGQRRIPLWDKLGEWVLYPRTMRRARWILCVSHSTRDKLIELFPEVFHKTIVLTSGVEDLYRTHTEAATADLICSRLKVPDKFVLYSGSTGENKNIPKMLQAFARLAQADERCADYHFVLDIIGDVGELQKLRLLAKQYGIADRLTIMNGITARERHVLFERANLLFMASKEEGFGVPILKAQLSRVPVLAADSGALPEVLGEGGLLVDPDDVDDMTNLLEKALFDTQLREYLIDRGSKNTERFSWDDTAHQIKQIYELLF